MKSKRVTVTGADILKSLDSVFFRNHRGVYKSREGSEYACNCPISKALKRLYKMDVEVSENIISSNDGSDEDRFFELPIKALKFIEYYDALVDISVLEKHRNIKEIKANFLFKNKKIDPNHEYLTFVLKESNEEYTDED